MRDIKYSFTEAEAKKYHRYMWRWLARNPSKIKEDWPGFKVFYAISLCFACSLAWDRSLDFEAWQCDFCPITKWRTRGGESKERPCVVGKYGEWREISLFDRAFKNENLEKRSKLALEISELDWE